MPFTEIRLTPFATLLANHPDYERLINPEVLEFVKSNSHTYICIRCHREAQKRCSDCKIALYCSEECQVEFN